jgi:hypothetical protein
MDETAGVIVCKVLESMYPACEESSVCKQAKKHVLHAKSMRVGNYASASYKKCALVHAFTCL